MPRSRRHFNLGGFRTFYYGAKTSLVLLVLFKILHLLFQADPDLGTIVSIFFMASIVAVIFFALQGGAVCLLGFVGDVRMRCPYCAAYGVVGADKENGLYMDCDRCGLVHAPNWLGWKWVKDPTPSSITYSWQRDTSVPLVLDLDNHQLNGVGIGGSVQALRFLGPARNNDSLWTYLFPDEGIQVEEDAEEKDRVHSFMVCLRPDQEADMEAFPGWVRYRGNLLSVPTLASGENVLRVFGDPYWRDEDEDEIILFYEFGHVEWQVELTLDGKTKALVVSPPILADSEQRRLYKVTRPWPPSENGRVEVKDAAQ